MRRGDRQGLGFGDLGHVLGIAETFRRFWLGIVVERLALGADQRGVLGFAPALSGAVHAGTMSWLADANPSPIALDDGQFRGLSGRWAKASAVLGSASRRSASSQPTSRTTRSIVKADVQPRATPLPAQLWLPNLECDMLDLPGCIR